MLVIVGMRALYLMLIFPSPRTGRPKRIKNEERPGRRRRLVGTVDKYSVIVNSSVATPDG